MFGQLPQSSHFPSSKYYTSPKVSQVKPSGLFFPFCVAPWRGFVSMQQYTCEIIVNDEFEPVLRVSLNSHHSLFVV